MRHDPGDPHWPNRDRFVLSAGHACMLQYAALHLTGYDLSLDDLKAFRQWGSKTPGHPEMHHTPGVETTTGPLGQGVGNAVGMALAERMLAARFNRAGPRDRRPPHVLHLLGRRPEGGRLGRGGVARRAPRPRPADRASTTTTTSRSRATPPCRSPRTSAERSEATAGTCCASTTRGRSTRCARAVAEAHADPRPAHDHPAHPHRVRRAEQAGHGRAPTASRSAPTRSALTKRASAGPRTPSSSCPTRCAEHCDRRAQGEGAVDRAGRSAFDGLPRGAPRPRRRVRRARRPARCPTAGPTRIPTFTPDDGAMATRAAGGKVLQALAAAVPELVGGSADLAPSTSTLMKEHGSVTRRRLQRPQHPLGHPRARHGRGPERHGRPRRAARRFGARSSSSPTTCARRCGSPRSWACPSIYVWTHDSVGLGEDGPTHQPVEHADGAAAIPDLVCIRPGRRERDGLGVARRASSAPTGPTGLVLTRQGLPTLAATADGGTRPRGAYVLAEADGDLDAIVIATGLRGARCAGGARHAAGRGHRRARRVDAVVGAVRAAGRRLPRAGAAARGHRAGLGRGRRAVGWERWIGDRGHASASTGSAPRRRARSWRASSASRRRPWSRP